ncbi:MAG: chromosome segregation protein SMC [Clostridiales bacterium]|nr:chromosome segregation protein SMC [Clostridiales bacterium]
MRLQSLELQGFKTFPDKTKLTFDHGISAVVGPNGSGKSNISDAMRWVLGEQSTRVLRCSKMEDIVFNGTPSRRAQGFAQVTLTIDNRSRALNFDGDTVAITRRYYRSGESEYQINHATVRLKDVHELFMDTGLGRDGYSIIGQGKIDSVVSARSEERREIFEEAAGISRYRYRKEESERKLTHAEENLLRLHDIVGELESRVGPLREQAEKAKQYLAYAEEKRGLEIGLWLHTLSHSGRILREHDDKIAIARKQQMEILQAIDQLDTAMEENFQQTNACTIQAEELRSQAARKEEEAVRLEGNISVLQNDIQHNQASLKRLEQEGLALKQEESKAAFEQEEKRLTLAKIKQVLTEKQQEFFLCSRQLEQLREGMAQFSGKLEEDTRRFELLSAQCSEAKLAAWSAESSQQEITLRLAAIQEALEGKNLQAHELEQAVAQWEGRVRVADRQVVKLQETSKQGELGLVELRRQEEQAKKKRDQANLNVQEQQRRIHLLEELERNLEGFAHSVKTILRESSKGALPGIHGPVSRLITVPKEYAVAIETALGAAMQNIVVGTEEDAKAAIRFLKQKNGGRATFLPLSTIQGSFLSEPGLEKCSGFVGVAGQLCQCEAQYIGILRSLLGRIVVATDLDAATALARQYRYRFRVVTLDGQVIHPGGSLTGGSLVKHAGLISRAAEIEQLKQNLETRRQQESKAVEQWKQAQAQTIQAAAEIERVRARIAEAQEYRVTQNSQWNRVRSDWETLQHQRRELEQDYQLTATRREDLETVKQQAQAQQEILEGQIAQVQQALGKLSGNQAESNQRVEQLSHLLQEVQLASLSAEKDQETLSAALRELERQQQDRNQRICMVQHEKALVEQKNQELEGQIRTSEETVRRLRRETQEAQKAGAAVQSRRLELEQRSVTLRNQEREQSNAKELVGRELARLEERKAGLQKEYDEIITRLWEEYELTRREAEGVAVPVEDPAKAQRRLNELKNQIRALGAVNVAAVEEYREVLERYTFLTHQLADVEKSRDELRRLIRELTSQMHDQFLEQFQQINQNFKQTFAQLFGGGSAYLELENPEDILACGIQIAVQPPGKIVSNLELLSGGEKALVAIALYFAIMKVSPPPFCVMDEIEAALDESNVERFAAYLRRMNANTQFVVITHRRGTMEEADILYGVTMQEEGVSKLLEMKPTELEQKLGMK